MKKILKLALTASLISLSAFASDTGMTSIALGMNKVSFNNGGTSNSSVYTHIDGFSNTSEYGLAFGLGGDIVGFGTAGRSSGNYTMGAQLKLGYSLYSLINYPVHIKAEAGYGVTRFDDKNYWGSQYGASLDVAIYKLLGAGVAFKYVDTSIGGSMYDSYTTNIIFLQLSFLN